jgi:hypothetical protein
VDEVGFLSPYSGYGVLCQSSDRGIGLSGRRKEAMDERGCNYYIVIREATRKMAASHTRQERQKYILDTILILSHV